MPYACHVCYAWYIQHERVIIMTAAIVSERGKDLTATVQGLECPALEGNNESARRQAATPGQLWERAAESYMNPDAMTVQTWRRIAAIRNQLGTRHPDNGDPRGYLAGFRDGWANGHMAYTMNPDASGFIEAGRRRRPPAYRHTGFEAGAL